MHPQHRDDLADTALAVHAEHTGDDGWHHLEIAFRDARHAEWALWRLGARAEALTPPWLRTALHDRAAAITALYRNPPQR